MCYFVRCSFSFHSADLETNPFPARPREKQRPEFTIDGASSVLLVIAYRPQTDPEKDHRSLGDISAMRELICGSAA
jgi:hypothetical protein